MNRTIIKPQVIAFAIALLVSIILSSPCCLAQDAVPKLINYQGRLTDASGTPLSNGIYRVRFELYANPTGTSNLIWGAEYDLATVQGQFNVVLGAAGGAAVAGAAVNDIGYAFGSPSCYLQVTVLTNGTSWTQPQVLSPRQQMLASPFAIQAQFALHGVPTGTVVAWAGDAGSTAPVPDSWILANGQTIGSASSGAAYPSEYARKLFSLLWGSFSNAQLPIQNSAGAATTRGASPDADFDADKRLPTPDLRGRVAAGHDIMRRVAANQLTGTSGGVSGSTMGATGGAQEHTLNPTQMPSHSHSMQSAGGHLHTLTASKTANGSGFFAGGDDGVEPDSPYDTSSAGAHTHTINPTGNGNAHNNVQPTIILYYLIKL